MAKQNFNELIKKAKSSNQQKTIQKVTPIRTSIEAEVQFSFYLSKQLLKDIKQQALDENDSIKNVINKALEQYLKNK
ncbi:hypothetical protein [uncultured Christiangramia sp.]|uniref:hypothetical protein n=1 Tax=uncultured Christiangramia sp. TaxID=503836 RepID=UPI002606D4F1|nr:hypothetical protein [uncultured Christiangramia sp.]